jgi:hypothetical protein
MKCLYCSKEISDINLTCPNCGYGFENHIQYDTLLPIANNGYDKIFLKILQEYKKKFGISPFEHLCILGVYSKKGSIINDKICFLIPDNMVLKIYHYNVFHGLRFIEEFPYSSIIEIEYIYVSLFGKKLNFISNHGELFSIKSISQGQIGNLISYILSKDKIRYKESDNIKKDVKLISFILIPLLIFTIIIYKSIFSSPNQTTQPTILENIDSNLLSVNSSLGDWRKASDKDKSILSIKITQNWAKNKNYTIENNDLILKSSEIYACISRSSGISDVSINESTETDSQIIGDIALICIASLNW